MEGVIEHSYYHLGQIVIIKKMVDGEVNTQFILNSTF